MQTLAGVFFQVKPCDTDLLGDIAYFDVNETMLCQRLIVLRNLISLRQVWVKVILAGKDRSLINAAVQSHRRQRGELYRLRVEYRQRTRHPQTDRTHIGIWSRSEASRAGTENLTHSKKLDVDFQTNNRLVFSTGRLGAR